MTACPDCGGPKPNAKALRCRSCHRASYRERNPAEDRFWRKVRKTDECWEWDGAVGSHGYGTFWDGGAFVLAHRYSLQLVGLLRADLHVDHLCRNKVCVRPDHLEMVTQRENNRRAFAGKRYVTHCPQGHPYDDANTIVNRKGYRECRICARTRQRQRYHRERSAL